jgi:hypothetical protein
MHCTALPVATARMLCHQLPPDTLQPAGHAHNGIPRMPAPCQHMYEHPPAAAPNVLAQALARHLAAAHAVHTSDHISPSDMAAAPAQHEECTGLYKTVKVV